MMVRCRLWNRVQRQQLCLSTEFDALRNPDLKPFRFNLCLIEVNIFHANSYSIAAGPTGQ